MFYGIQKFCDKKLKGWHVLINYVTQQKLQF